MKIATAAQMLECDRLASAEYGIDSLTLMENAGRGTVSAMVRHQVPLAGMKILILTGPGNNGGDGLVIARLLLEQGARPRVLSLAPLDGLKAGAATNLALLRRLPIPVFTCLHKADLPLAARLVAKSGALVDAIFGIGPGRELVGVFAAVVELINGSGLPVVAVDIPSGLDADTGLARGVSVRATHTCTYGLPKFALVEFPGREQAGRLSVVDIGIPEEVAAQVGVKAELLVQDLVREMIPRRAPASHKGSFGHLLVLAGSSGKGGAAALCAHAALRSGAGLVTAAVPRSVADPLQAALPEVMSEPLTFSRSCLSETDYEQILAAGNRLKAVAAGPGIGTAEETGHLIRRLCAELPRPMVLDADALNLLVGESGLAVAGPRILTPHPGEMARLTGLSVDHIQAARREVAGDFARAQGVYLVLKGAATVVAAPDGRLAVNSTGNQGMAAAGMGDVLTGLIGGLLAQGLPPWEAACLGVYLHGLAGDLLVRDGFNFGFLAGELAVKIPEAFRETLEGRTTVNSWLSYVPRFVNNQPLWEKRYVAGQRNHGKEGRVGKGRPAGRAAGRAALVPSDQRGSGA